MLLCFSKLGFNPWQHFPFLCPCSWCRELRWEALDRLAIGHEESKNHGEETNGS